MFQILLFKYFGVYSGVFLIFPGALKLCPAVLLGFSLGQYLSDIICIGFVKNCGPVSLFVYCGFNQIAKFKPFLN